VRYVILDRWSKCLNVRVLGEEVQQALSLQNLSTVVGLVVSGRWSAVASS
jgi:hypothetical protein